MDPRLNNVMLLDKMVQVANRNAERNFGRTFNRTSLRNFLDSCLVWNYWEYDGELSGVISVKQDGEFGLLLNPDHPREAGRGITEFLKSIEGVPVWVRIRRENETMLRAA